MSKTDYIPSCLLIKLDGMKDRLNQPGTVWKIILFIFGLGVTWSSLNYRITRLEEFQDTVDIVEIQTTLKEISTDLSWIKQELSKLNK